MRSLDDKWPWLVAVLFLALCFSQSNSYQCEANEQANQITCEDFPAAHVLLGWAATKSPEYWIALFTGVLTAATILLWLATRQLFVGAERTSRAQLRAYVGQRLQIAPEQIGNEWSVTARLHNYGATPAYSILVWSDLSALTEDEAKTFQFPSAPVEIGSEKFTIFPHSKPHTHVCKQVFTEQELLEIKTCARSLYITGEIRYADTFGDGWVTQFRLFFHVFESEQGIQGMWRYCSRGNDAT